MSEQEGITTKKSENFSKWFSEVVQKAELGDIRYNVKGFLVHRHWAVRIMKNMYKLLEEELERRGHKPVWFPAVIPESNLRKESEHVEGFLPGVFWITEGGKENKKLEERLALRPTSETAMYPMYSLWIRSWRDLPFKRYQSCQVWRFEGKGTRPFIRGREFYWIESHNAFATLEDAMNQVKEDMEITKKFMHDQCGIPFKFFKRPDHDKFPGAVHTYAADSIMPDGKAIQQPSTHLLGQNFAKPFNIKFVDKNGKEKYVWQTCYGPAIWRIFASLIAVHGDDKGLILPPKVAPIHVVIVPIIFEGKERIVLNKAKKVKKFLEKNRILVKLDDREEYTPGWKFNEWELKGVPIRMEIGPKDVEKKQVILVRRDSGKKIVTRDTMIVKSIKKLLNNIQKNLIQKADKFMNEYFFKAKNMKQLKKIIKEKGGFVRINWCGSIDCADNIKSETEGSEMKGTLFGKKEKPDGNCIWCGKKAKEVVYVAKAY